MGVFYFLFPTVVVVCLILARTTYGRRLFAIGTNDVAGRFAGIDVQFAAARPDAGTSGTAWHCRQLRSPAWAFDCTPSSVHHGNVAGLRSFLLPIGPVSRG